VEERDCVFFGGGGGGGGVKAVSTFDYSIDCTVTDE